MTQSLFDKDDILIRVHVEIWGPDDRLSYIDCILDTGATRTIIDQFSIEALGYDLKNAPKDHIITAQGTAEVPRIKVDKIMVGEIVCEHFPLGCYELPEDLKKLNIQGIIGLDFMRDYKVVIDFQNGILEFL